MYGLGAAGGARAAGGGGGGLGRRGLAATSTACIPDRGDENSGQVCPPAQPHHAFTKKFSNFILAPEEVCRQFRHGNPLWLWDSSTNLDEARQLARCHVPSLEMLYRMACTIMTL